MAKALLVIAHPVKTSLTHLFAELVSTTLQSRGIAVDWLDLYEEKFVPALTNAERSNYYTADPELTLIGDYAQRLQCADTLILVFPTWWFGLPAILKGWIDRTFAPSIAYDHAKDLSSIKPRLTNLKSVLVITTLGSPSWVDWLVMRRPVRRVLKTAIFGICAPQAKFAMLSLYSAEKLELPQIDLFKSKILKAIARQ